MPIKINVPFEQKDVAKKMGAIWAPDVKTWTIPDHIEDINPFKPWLPQDRGGSFAKYPYLIAKSNRTCWKCHNETPLIGLGAKKYTTSAFDSTLTNIEWKTYDYPAFFVDIRYIDHELSAILNAEFPFFQEKYSKKLKEKTWVNTCIYCQTIQGDDYNIDNTYVFGGYLNEKRTLFRGKHMEQISLRFDYYVYAAIYEGQYYWDGYEEAE